MGDPIQAGAIGKAWSFDSSAIADHFDSHVAAQLPWYPLVSQFVADMAVSFLPSGGCLYDIGASTGNITRLMRSDLVAKNARVVSVEKSPEMCARFSGHGTLICDSIENVVLTDSPNVIICFLVLMFLSPAIRREVVREMRTHLAPGGALIIVDKGFVETPAAQIACKAAALAGKMRSGVSAEAYTSKELSLRGQQIPINEHGLLYELIEDGDMTADTFFRFGEFFGILAIKDEWNRQ